MAWPTTKNSRDNVLNPVSIKVYRVVLGVGRHKIVCINWWHGILTEKANLKRSCSRTPKQKKKYYRGATRIFNFAQGIVGLYISVRLVLYRGWHKKESLKAWGTVPCRLHDTAAAATCQQQKEALQQNRTDEMWGSSKQAHRPARTYTHAHQKKRTQDRHTYIQCPRTQSSGQHKLIVRWLLLYRSCNK